MRKIQETAPAKINLFLKVIGRRHDGYHLLYSHVAFSNDISDTLTFHPDGQAFRLNVKGPFSKGTPENADNLVYKAAQKMSDKFNLPFTGRLILHKNLPSAAGIGGGSADAAAMIRILIKHHNITDMKAVKKLALELGADVPMCLDSQPALVKGVGENIYPVRNAPPCGILLINPKQHVSTPAVFKELKMAFNPILTKKNSSGFHDYFNWLSQHTNDLAAPAAKICPDINHVLDALRRDKNARLIRMSGSGATCFALYENEGAAKKAARRLKKHHKNWWVKSGTINRP